MVAAIRERQDKPPKVGPYATRRWTGERWEVRLTADGQRLVEDHLRDHPEPARVLAKMDPETFYKLHYGDWEEGDDVARFALVKAAATFDPDRGATFITWSSWWVRAYCQRHLEKRAGEPDEPISGDWPISGDKKKHRGCFWDILPGREDDRPSQLELDELAAVLRRAVRVGGLTDLERRQVAAVYGEGLSYGEAAEAGTGPSAATVKHHVHNGLKKLRNRAAPMLRRCGYP